MAYLLLLPIRIFLKNWLWPSLDFYEQSQTVCSYAPECATREEVLLIYTDFFLRGTTISSQMKLKNILKLRLRSTVGKCRLVFFLCHYLILTRQRWEYALTL
jgi:hypothetical protein